MMMFGVATVRVPAAGWRPAGFDPATVAAKPLVTTENVSAGNAIRTPQFWLLWIVLFCNVTAGIGILEQAAPMIQDFFRSPTARLHGHRGRGRRLRRPAVPGQHGRPVRLVVHLGPHRPQAGSTCSTSVVGIVLYAMLATLGHQSTCCSCSSPA